jgi:hypothetical protein
VSRVFPLSCLWKGDRSSTASRVSTADGRKGSGSGDLW